MIKLTDNIEESFSLNDGLTRQNYARDLKVAIREALVNTLMHAYYDTKQSIKIVNCEDFIEFYNPGNMRINKEDFIHGGIQRTEIVYYRRFQKSRIFRKSWIWRTKDIRCS